MLISKVSDGKGDAKGEKISKNRDHSPEYRTANELFDLMTKNRNFDFSGDDPLTTRDLVLLYKNLDVGTRLMNDANEIKLKKPNQYVETIIYNDEPDSDSDLSEICSAEDIGSVFTINQERLDFLNDKSLENILCHKFGGLEIKSSDLSAAYNNHFLFKDPYIKKELKNLNVMGSCSEFDNMFSTSLLDYICCKRLEDNYNFYMDNIIRYVQNTIEQLRRISNGDYLTDRAKDKWRKVNYSDDPFLSTKVLATSTSIPLNVECKRKGNATWDDIVHSEVDVRSLSKILERKIVVEIPKLICGTYRLYSKQYADNLIISCKREQKKIDETGKDSRVDVILQLQRSQTGQVMSKINSIMILQAAPALQEISKSRLLHLPYEEHSKKESLNDVRHLEETVITNMEYENDGNKNNDNLEQAETIMLEDTKKANKERVPSHELHEIQIPSYDVDDGANDKIDMEFHDEITLPMSVAPIHSEASFNLISPDELRITMQKLNIQTLLPEESGEETSPRTQPKKRSPVRVRIKSPYENKSYLMEEKKRKRLLEIREKRERKKIVLNENCKISKHKFGKGTITPQASSSVTKLSITNKSFYNSIYGQSLNLENQMKSKAYKLQNNSPQLITDAPIQEVTEEYLTSPLVSPDLNSKKYINRSYYLDDAETEIMFTKLKQNDDKYNKNDCSVSLSATSNELSADLNLLKDLIGPTDIGPQNEQSFDYNQTQRSRESQNFTEKDSKNLSKTDSSLSKVPDNSPANITVESETNNSKIVSSSVECRKSIDKLYELMKKFGKSSGSVEVKDTKCKLVSQTAKSEACDSTIQGSDSGTSIKHHLTSSVPSSFSIDKIELNDNLKASHRNKNNRQPTTTVPKVVISSKSQLSKIEIDKIKKERKKVSVSQPLKVMPENPLKAISQLLHEFDNVQKNRQKPVQEPRHQKRIDNIITVHNDEKNITLGSFKRRSRFDQHMKDEIQGRKIVTPRDKKYRSVPLVDVSRNYHQQESIEERKIERISKKKIFTDILDEAKEARGEAVRGPSKLNSRLNSLAQPKRIYVQAQIEEYQHKYGKNTMADRLQKLSGGSSAIQERNLGSAHSRIRTKKPKSPDSYKAPTKQPRTQSPLDQSLNHQRRSFSSSPKRKHPTSGRHNSSEGVESREMVAVESYAKHHYGRTQSLKELLLLGNKSKIPHIPNDIVLDSATSSLTLGKANELGDRLHCMINTICTNAPVMSTLSEYPESTSQIDRIKDDTESVEIKDQLTDSDFHIDILEDKNLETAVEFVSTEINQELKPEPEDQNTTKYELQQLGSSSTELTNLEKALYNHISGSFQKRLRIKNLTLTPKHSMQQVLLLQSGDASSLIVNSTLSSTKISKCSTENLHAFFSNSPLDWNFAQFPVQVTTVGYAIPEYQAIRCSSNQQGNVLDANDSYRQTCTFDKINQCFKGYHDELQLSETAAQVDVDHADKIEASNSLVVIKEHINISNNYETSNSLERKHPTHKTEGDITITTDTSDSIKTTHLETIKGATQMFSATETLSDNVKTNDSHAIKEETLYGDAEMIKVDFTKDPAPSVASSESQSLPAKVELKKVESTTDEMLVVTRPNTLTYSSSLDILVGLLNEIQKITCQNQITTVTDREKYRDIENILNDAYVRESEDKIMTRDLVSISSLDELRKLESNPSIYSLYISNDESGTNESNIIQVNPNKDLKCERSVLCFADKEVNVNIFNMKDKIISTEVSTRLMPMVVSRSTNITNSLICINSEHSPQPVFCCQCHLMKEISFDENNNLHNFEEPEKQRGVRKICAITDIPLLWSDKYEKNNHKVTCLAKVNMGQTITKNRIASGRALTKCVSKIALDPMLKVKRDMLVTMYSILVLTIFAALFFPDIVMYENI